MATPEEREEKKLPETKVKICGHTNAEEVRWVIEEKADYAGFVLFVPKSKRNLSVEQARLLLDELKRRNGSKAGRTKSVAVVISPTKEQIRQIEQLGFDYIQIHGRIEKEAVSVLGIPVIRAIHIPEFPMQEAGGGRTMPVLRALHVTDEETTEAATLPEKLIEQIEWERKFFGGKVEAFLFDAKEPGSGKMFDWNLLREIRAGKEQMILAGGLDPSNVRMAVDTVRPDVVDVSSGVEICRETIGKNREKIREFMRKVRTDEQ